MATTQNGSKIVALLSSKQRVDAPFIRVRIGKYTFGVYDKSKGKITFPNLVTSMSIKKINGLVNSYTLIMTYPVTQDVDPNALEKVLSTNVRTRKIIFDYGDATQPNFVYRSEEAIITDVQTDVNIKSATLIYTISAQSTAVTSLSKSCTFGGIKDKPSNEIIKTLQNTSYKLLDVFTGMRNKGLSDYIATNDSIVEIPLYKGITPLEYISNLVACMRPYTYVLSTYDGDEGPYFKVSKVESESKVLNTIVTYNIDIGYPSADIITDFKLNDNSNWALYYEYANDTTISDTLSRLDNNGQLYQVQGMLYKGTSYNLLETDKSWWEKVTTFPVSATLTLKGLLKPAMLMQYVKINVWFFGKKHTSTGYYIITGQTDNISASNYSTTLNLTRIAGEEASSDIQKGGGTSSGSKYFSLPSQKTTTSLY